MFCLMLISGIVKDELGRYDVAFYLSGGINIVSSLIFVIIIACYGHRKSTSALEEVVVSMDTASWLYSHAFYLYLTKASAIINRRLY